MIDLALHGLDLAQMLLGEPFVDLDIALQRRIHDYPVDDGGMLIGRTAAGALVSLHVAYNHPEALPRRRLEVVGDAGLLVATNTMGQTAGGTLTYTSVPVLPRRREPSLLMEKESGPPPSRGHAEQIAISFDATLSPFTAQARAFAAAVAGAPHDFSLPRDIRLMRLFDAAYTKARSCL